MLKRGNVAGYQDIVVTVFVIMANAWPNPVLEELCTLQKPTKASGQWPTVQNLTGKVSEFRHLSGERLFTVPSSATTVVIHEMLRHHIQLPVSCLVIFPVAQGLGGDLEPCPYQVIESPKALRRLESAEFLEDPDADASAEVLTLYRRCFLCQDFRADVVDGSSPLVTSCQACGFMECICASCLMRTAVNESRVVFVYCLRCLADPDSHDEVHGLRVRAQLSALSPSQKAWLENGRRWLPEEQTDDLEMEEVD